MIRCLLCQQEQKNFKVLSFHLTKKHNEITKEDYYKSYLQKDDNESKCIICGKKTRFKDIVNGYNKTCSNRCTQLQPEVKEKIKQKFIDNYGGHPLLNKDVMTKLKNTNMEKYGIDNPAKTIESKEKIKKTNLEKYGFESHNSSPIVKENKKISNINKYGVENVSQSIEIQNNKRISYYNRLINMDRFKNKVTPLFSINEYKGVDSIKYKFKCNKCENLFEDNIDNGRIPRCYICYPHIITATSKYETEIIDFIKSKLPNAIIIQSDRTQIHPYELDIYLPEYNLAIEFNGLYWHSESQGKDVSYHINKTILCKEKGIQLIHIFEDEWINKVDIIKSMICNKLKLNDTKIYARKCEIQNVNYDISSQFLENNHIQGAIKSNINLGLYYNQELVSLLTLGHSRFNSNYDYEIHRFCNLKNTNVIGGFSKLIKYFKKLNTGSIITYADLRYGTGDVYLNNGFKFLYRSKPNYFYFKSSECKRYSRHKFQKHKLKNILQEYDSELSEYQNMQLNDYERIWDCGNNVYVII